MLKCFRYLQYASCVAALLQLVGRGELRAVEVGERNRAKRYRACKCEGCSLVF